MSPRARPVWITASLLVLIHGFLWTALALGPAAHLTVTFLDVGEGDCAFIECPGGGSLLVDGGESRGHRFLNRALQVLTRMPPADRLLASRQLRSRFVRVALKQVPDPGGG